jgi:hypothetical protein
MLQNRVVLFVIVVTKTWKQVCGVLFVKRGFCSFCSDIWLSASITHVYYFAADDSYNTEDYSHGRRGENSVTVTSKR